VVGILRTLGRVFVGFVLACLAAGLVQVLFVDTPAELAARPVAELAVQGRSTLELVLLAATHFAIFSVAFALIAAGIAEWLSLRGTGYWLASGMGIALLGFVAQYASEVAGQPSILNNYALQAYLTAGFFGGLVYWLVAGSRSGADRRDDAEPETTAGTPVRPRIIVEDGAPNPVKKGSLAEKLALKRGAIDAGETEATPPPASGPVIQKSASKPAVPNKDAPKPQPQPASATAVPVTKSDGAAKSQKTPDSAANPSPKGNGAPAKTV
jgi:hypothetical protein